MRFSTTLMNRISPEKRGDLDECTLPASIASLTRLSGRICQLTVDSCARTDRWSSSRSGRASLGDAGACSPRAAEGGSPAIPFTRDPRSRLCRGERGKRNRKKGVTYDIYRRFSANFEFRNCHLCVIYGARECHLWGGFAARGGALSAAGCRCARPTLLAR